MKTYERPVVVVIQRSKQYNGGDGMPSHPGFAWKWLYTASVPEIRMTAGNGLAATDTRDLPYSTTDERLGEIKKRIKRLAPLATITLAWEVSACQS